MPLDHASGFEFADIGPAAIECSASADALTVAGLTDRGRETVALAAGARSMGTVSAMVSVPVATGQDSSLPLSAA